MQKISGVIFLIMGPLLYLAVRCGERAPLEIWETSMGERYEILQSGVIYSKTQGKIFLVRFKSKNVANLQIRQEEFCSLYKYIGKEYDLHGFDYVALDAAPSGEPIFGCTKMTVYRDMKSVDEITKPTPTVSL